MTRRSSLAFALRLCLPGLLALITSTDAFGQESWDAHYVSGSKVGYTHTWVEKVKDRGTGKDYLRVRLFIELTFKRDKDVSVMKMQYGTIETQNGEVLRLDTRTLVGEENDLRAYGDVRHGEMLLTLDGNGEHQSLRIPWGKDVRGPYAPEQSMAKTPMKEHEQRQLKMFIPDLNKVAEVTLASKTIEPVIMGDGSTRPLLRIEQTTKVDGKPKPEFNNIMWADSGGQVLKAEQEALGKFTTYRTTKEAAQAPGGPIQFDLITGTVAKTTRPIPNAEQTRQVKYRVKLNGGDIAQAIPTDARQSVQIENGQPSVILTVKSLGPLDGAAGPGEIDAQYLKSNVLITSDDTRVRSLTQRVTRGVADPWTKAERLNRWVFKSISDQNFRVGFAGANEVARNLSGDCSEHSVLMAAMCRACGIPARVVVGLVYVDKFQGFGFHMWNEVYINQRWVAVDSTFDQTTVDATHIKLSESSLEGVAPFEAFLPVLKVAGKIQIEPLELR